MRKYIIMFIILCSFGIGRGFGQVSDVSIIDNDQEQIMNDIRLVLDKKNRLNKSTIQQIQSEAVQLELLPRLVLRNEFEKTMDKPYLLMNLVPGMGSFIQGDVFGGIGGIISDLMLPGTFFLVFTLGWGAEQIWIDLALVAFIGNVATSFYFKFARPFSYIAKWNASLERALLLDDLDYQSDLEAFEVGMNIPEAAPDLINITLFQVRF